MKLKTTIALGLSALLLSNMLMAKDSTASFSVEIDPATYIFDGYALHLKKSFDTLPNWQFGIGAYAMDFPDVLVDTTPANRDEGWDQRLDSGIGIFVDYFFQEKQQGWYTGIQLAHQNYKITQNGTSANYATFLTMPYIGYQYDFYKSFYVKPWIGVGYNAKISGSNTVNGEIFEVPEVIIFPTIHIGYKF